jgi:hypothetical protein
MRTRARRNAQSSQLHTESKNGRYVYEGFGHPLPDVHSWQMLRVVVGLVVIGVGILIIQGTAGFVVAVIGLIPIFAALAGIASLLPSLGIHSRD